LQIAIEWFWIAGAFPENDNLVPVYECGRNLPTLFGFLYKLDPQPDLYVFTENNSEDNTLNAISSF
jgi:hypothetical protein